MSLILTALFLTQISPSWSLIKLLYLRLKYVIYLFSMFIYYLLSLLEYKLYKNLKEFLTSDRPILFLFFYFHSPVIYFNFE